jgi:hypothetical protein
MGSHRQDNNGTDMRCGEMVEVIRSDPELIEIPEVVIAGRLGFKGRSMIPENFREQYEDALRRIRKTATPIALVENVAVEFNYGSIRIEDLEIGGDLASKHLLGISRASVILATIGDRIDELIIGEEKSGNTFGSFMIDGIASEFVEFFVRHIDRILRNRPGNKYGRTRISPGYGDLPIELNQWIVNRLNGHKYGISVMEGSSQMIPRKTITAFIGWRDPPDE